MVDNKRMIAAAELLLIFPAALFLTAVAARNLGPFQYFSQQIVSWYAVRGWTLWILLLSLSLVALFIGSVTLLWNPSGGTKQLLAARPLFTVTRFIAGATLAAGFILVVVVLHMLAN